MDERYEVYCLAGSVFYESPARAGGPDFALAARPLPEGWSRWEQDDCLGVAPDGLVLPSQGWKVHVSATLENAEEVLARVWDHCTGLRVPFKFVRGERVLRLRNAKHADRLTTGKLATIYPADEAQLERVLVELGSALDGMAGPYVLSDLRFGAGPLYVRYGSFAERLRIGRDGRAVSVIEDGEGRLVADVRAPTFEVPPWVELPRFLEAHLAARGAATVEDMPYRIERALQFSNGGGLYLGEDPRSGDRVVLKEARPYAGLSADGADAVARQQREREILEHLAGLDAAPRLRDHFTLEDHHFLVRDQVEGETLSSLLVERFPITGRSLGEQAAAEYASWALDLHGKVSRALEAVHARGVVVGDLHPSNVLVRPDGGVTLIDFEVATLEHEERLPAPGAPGFTAPGDLTGFDVDRYALASLLLHLFLPLTPLFSLDRDAPRRLAEAIAELFPVPRERLAPAVGVLEGSDAPARAFEPGLAGWRDPLVAAILSSATPDSEDRLFPGDVQGFAPGGAVGLAHGAAGVLYALDAAGVEIPPEHLEWLTERALAPTGGTRLGFYDGLHGAAHVLHRLGRRVEALSLVDVCAERLAGMEERLGLDLYGGLSGIGLNLLHLGGATGDTALLGSARAVAGVVADRLGEEDALGERSGGDHPVAGLMRGSSGPALMFIRLYERTGDAALLDLAEIALRQDLRRCVPSADGALHVNEGWRTTPYLAEGTVGIGMVLEDFLSHRRDERFEEAAIAIRRAAGSIFHVQAGLFRGRAGMVLHLGRRPLGAAGEDPLAAAQARRLAWHAVPYGGGLAFPGEGLLRLSMDLATGTAGVLLALGAFSDAGPAGLPFIGPIGTARRASGNGVILAPEGACPS